MSRGSDGKGKGFPEGAVGIRGPLCFGHSI